MSDVVEGTAVEETDELVPVEASEGRVTLWRTDDPGEVLKRATDTANALKPVLDGQGMTQNIQGKSHVKVEGWVTLGSMLGVTPVCTWTRPVKEPSKGWEARVEARTLDGRTIGAAEAMCVRSENRWKDAEDYAIRSMAQTRATSKALGSVLRFVVTLAGYSGTPAEEMDGVPQGEARQAAPTDKQIDYLGNLLRKRPDVTGDDVVLMQDWARANLSGGREGSLSETLDILKNGGERSDKAVNAMAERVVEWQKQQTDVPADTEGLFPEADAA